MGVRALAAIAVLTALGLAGCGGGSPGPGETRVTSTPATSGHLSRHGRRRPIRRAPVTLARLRTAMSAALRPVSGQGAEIYDLTSHTVLFKRDARVVRAPASVEKLYTSLAVLRRLGASARLSTEVLGVGHLGRHGVWHGNLYLRGGGDPTFGDGAFNRAWNYGQGPTPSQLVSQLSARGIHRVAGRVIGDPSLFDAAPGGPATGFAPDIPDLGGELSGLVYDHGATAGRLSPGAFAARELVLIMRHAHIRARARKTTAATPPGSQTLASVSSPTMLALLKLMNVRSDDLFAELLTKLLGVRFGAAGSTAAGARVVASTAAQYGLRPRIVDGSGLSRSDRSSPEQVVTLLRSLWHTPEGRELDSTLPTVGVNGTTAHIGLGTRAQGRCIAKTGTLDGVTNLAGLCRSRGGHMLDFALFLDGPTLDQARTLLTRMVGAMASY
jgi:D-alanyl-D-alanine carboxypeptidase/D-alanyl-D-alanine-endopeptidase (penicillin-binding protein 4)